MAAVDAAASCHNAAAEIQDQLTGLKRYMLGLEVPPGAVAEPAFEALMTGYDIYAQMLNDALIDIASGLDAAAR